MTAKLSIFIVTGVFVFNHGTRFFFGVTWRNPTYAALGIHEAAKCLSQDIAHRVRVWPHCRKPPSCRHFPTKVISSPFEVPIAVASSLRIYAKRRGFRRTPAQLHSGPPRIRRTLWPSGFPDRYYLFKQNNLVEYPTLGGRGGVVSARPRFSNKCCWVTGRH